MGGYVVLRSFSFTIFWIWILRVCISVLPIWGGLYQTTALYLTPTRNQSCILGFTTTASRYFIAWRNDTHTPFAHILMSFQTVLLGLTWFTCGWSLHSVQMFTSTAYSLTRIRCWNFNSRTEPADKAMLYHSCIIGDSPCTRTVPSCFGLGCFAPSQLIYTCCIVGQGADARIIRHVFSKLSRHLTQVTCSHFWSRIVVD